jgi:radical SAM protein with 4Fe4S-binding SPASM domain
MFNFNTQRYAAGYVPYAITFADTFPGCTASDHLTVRLGDMAICPCHRTAYNKFLYGHFIIQDNQIVDIEAINPEIASRILLSNNNLTSIGCDTCIFNKICLKGCFGSQYETMKDPFFPIENVCKLFKAKYQFLLQKYFSLDIISYLSNISPYNLHYVQAQEFLQFFKEVKPYVD